MVGNFASAKVEQAKQGWNSALTGTYGLVVEGGLSEKAGPMLEKGKATVSDYMHKGDDKKNDS